MNRIIRQAGMGVNISNWSLARICSMHEKVLGTVSLVAAGPLMARFLQMGDQGGHYRRALAHFPFPGVAERIVETYFVEGGIAPGQEFKTTPVFTLTPSFDTVALTVAASFAFVWLAKEGHTGPISVNLLEKIQVSLTHHIYGAMLAGVDEVTMGAGMTMQIPGVLDAFAHGQPAHYRVTVQDSKDGFAAISFDPHCFGRLLPELVRPEFAPIVSLDVLAKIMVDRLPKGSIQSFCVERPIAGGHNASPRGQLQLNEKGEPIYGVKDIANMEKLRQLGIPFWIGGGVASPEYLAEVQAEGAAGIQVGTLFALCENSGMKPDERAEIRRLAYRGELVIRTDPKASPTGFPFKVVQLPGTLSDRVVYEARERVCDLCALFVPYQKEDGTIGYRCPSEPTAKYVQKGGRIEDTVGARCLCNGLLSAAGLGSPGEARLFTLGDDVSSLHHLMKHENDSYTASDVIAYLLGTPRKVRS